MLQALSWPTGSSPRVRGTPPHRPCRPARYPVHPRVCGELGERCGRAAWILGSSPRVRGTRVVAKQFANGHRFIPACAGNSLFTTRLSSPLSGSSPRVRGTRPPGSRPCGSRRFIPACAGNSRAFGSSAPACSVHPRVCGELLKSQPFATIIIPVHPRVCGELAGHAAPGDGGSRFIPACAGNSQYSTFPSQPTVGSSPRVRGTHRGRMPQAVRRRFIPACAGNSSPPRLRICWRTVHPRVCGELLARTWLRDQVQRFIPARVRGTREAGYPVVDPHRFIPACAGNSRASLKA